MASTALEQCRQAHEDIELLTREAVKVLEEEPKHTKGRMLQQHKTHFLVQHTVERSQTSLDLYADKDGLMKEEIAAMKGVDVFKGFYDQLKSIKEYHRRFPDVQVGSQPIQEALAAHMGDVEQLFSGEEVYGKYLDLHSFYVRACNMPQFRIREEYRSFIDKLDKFSHVPQAKKDAGYMEYLRDLLLYLANFYIRSQPLVVAQEVFDDCINDFEAKWLAGTFEGWKLEPHLRGGEADESNLLFDNADLDLEKVLTPPHPCSLRYTSVVDSFLFH
jgi:splicing factor 3A subunit 3